MIFGILYCFCVFSSCLVVMILVLPHNPTSDENIRSVTVEVTCASVDLEQILACQIFLQQRRVYSELQRIAIRGLQPWQPQQVPAGQGKENLLQRGKDLRRDVVNKGSMARHWPSPGQERGVCLLPAGVCYRHRHESSPFRPPGSI